jgi:hypothetical protein
VRFSSRGVEDLLGHHGGALSAHETATPAEDVTVNNYYGTTGDEARPLGIVIATPTTAATDDDFV